MDELLDDLYRYSRDKLPSGGESYPVKRSDVDRLLAGVPRAAIAEVSLSHLKHRDRSPAAFAERVGWHGRLPSQSGHGWTPLCHVTWRGRHRSNVYEPEGASLWIYAVPAARRADLRRRMVAEALPQALRWVAGVQSWPETRRTERAGLLFYESEGVLQREEA